MKAAARHVRRPRLFRRHLLRLRASPIPKALRCMRRLDLVRHRDRRPAAHRRRRQPVERMGGTGGFLLGIAFDGAGNAFCCDLRHAAVFRWDAASGEMRRFASSGIRVPNYPVIDEARGYLYVSDSLERGIRGSASSASNSPAAKGGLWCRAPMQFANGMAMAPDGSGLYVVESDAPQRELRADRQDGSAGAKRLVVPDVQNVPDGLAFAPDGSLFISCYEPSPHLSLARGPRAGAADRGPGGDHHRAPDQRRLQGRPALHGQSRPLAHHRDRPFDAAGLRGRAAACRLRLAWEVVSCTVSSWTDGPTRFSSKAATFAIIVTAPGSGG